MIAYIAYKNIRHKPLAALLSIVLVAFGVGLVSVLSSSVQQITQKFERNIQGIDMIVGAKGSPLQLVLSALLQADAPTGNISQAAAQRIARHRMVRTALRLAYGDSYFGYKIVGCDTQYLGHFGAVMAQGTYFHDDFQVCVGSTVASKLQLKVGDRFAGAHGAHTTAATQHTAHPYTVVGILRPTNSVLDQLITCTIPSVWHTHEDSHENHQENHQENTHEPAADTTDRQITALLIKFKSPMALLQLPRYINAQPHLQAALPAIEINRLLALIDTSTTALYALAALIMAVSALSIFIALYTSLQARQPELALMRLMGSTPTQLFLLIMTEAILLTTIGYLLGIVASRCALYALGQQLAQNFNDNINAFFKPQPHELWLAAACLCIAFVAAIVPAVVAYRTPIALRLSAS